jgi:hypothetical protein
MRSVAGLLVALAAVLAFQGCSGQTSTSSFSQDAGSKGAKTCDPAFCPVVGSGAACCINNTCGADYGMGCVQTVPDGGH